MIDEWGLLARACLGAVFLWSGLTKVLDPADGVTEIAEMHLPMPKLVLIVTILCQLGAGTMVLLGFWTSLGALALLGFTLVATLLGHRITGLSGQARRQQITTSLEHLAIMGGFLLLILYGPGQLSLDALLR
jgi:putative oxidoreductase